MGSSTQYDLAYDQIRSLLKLPRIGQIGYVVDDVYHTIKQQNVTHKNVSWLVLDHDHQRSIAGKQGRCSLRIALAYKGSLQLELIQVLKGDTIHVVARNATDFPIHHLGFMVNNLEQHLKYCLVKGARLLQKGTIKSSGITVNYAYLDVSGIGGTNLVFELIQWRLGLLPMPVNRYIFLFLLRLGSWNIFQGKIVR